uniref:Macaca fascicularis brain cDNA, clone: QmoA-10449 n=1 Tax=Macaca fascicularis TaxID=9541 RepID=I7GJ14_MACFA|nr:unnamed protein product [Macaca fascicularis]
MLFCTSLLPSRLFFLLTFFHHNFVLLCIHFLFSVRKQVNNYRIDHKNWRPIRLYNNQGLQKCLEILGISSSPASELLTEERCPNDNTNMKLVTL